MYRTGEHRHSQIKFLNIEPACFRQRFQQDFRLSPHHLTERLAGSGCDGKNQLLRLDNPVEVGERRGSVESVPVFHGPGEYLLRGSIERNDDPLLGRLLGAICKHLFNHGLT